MGRKQVLLGHRVVSEGSSVWDDRPGCCGTRAKMVGHTADGGQRRSRFVGQRTRGRHMSASSRQQVLRQRTDRARPFHKEACSQDGLEFESNNAASRNRTSNGSQRPCTWLRHPYTGLWGRACAAKPSCLSWSFCQTSAVTYPPGERYAQWRQSQLTAPMSTQ